MSTVWQVAFGTATGRGFSGVDPDGLLAKFKEWIVKAPSATPNTGGPGWFIHDDQSALGTDPYIVVCDVNAPAVNSMNNGPSGLPPKFIKVGMINTSAGNIRVSTYLWWDNSTHVGYGPVSGYYVYTYDSATFEYRFRGGHCGLVIHTRLASAWHHAGILDWEGDSNLVEGTDKYGVLQSGITAGSSVVLQLAAGQAANFTRNKWYFLFDFNGQHWVNYCKVTNVNTGANQITIDYCQKNFQSGSVIAAYAHRFHCFGKGISGYEFDGTTGINTYYSKSCIPYVSSNEYSSYYGNMSLAAWWPSYSYNYQLISVTFDAAVGIISRLNYNDDKLQAVMRPILLEYHRANDVNNSTWENGMNRAYGQTKHLYICKNNSFSTGADGKIINGKNYVKFGTVDEIAALNYGLSSGYAFLFLDSESTT